MVELARDELDVGLVAFDVEAMLRFYGEGLGLPSAGKMKVPGIGAIHRFGVGASVLKVLEPEVPTTARPVGGPPQAAAGVRYVTLHVTDLAAALQQLGAPTVAGPEEPVPGIRYAIVADPDGNCVELVEGA